ncbi:hypothetical protein [Microbulbifer halophilus]|uniref:Ketosteroid isomerase n=1 Tax=Microbulbifer halophilus TaxID=453963 RepID=A0ABW5EGR8_9GAMM|nr:hypothetical protein [Microbulbifer halophilus]MCW8128304.1 hypothetical protein [Microbulbifer halophilus]
MKIQDTRSTAAQLLERLGAADAEGVQALFAEKIDWFVPGSTALPWVGPRTRRGQVASFRGAQHSLFTIGESS